MFFNFIFHYLLFLLLQKTIDTLNQKELRLLLSYRSSDKSSLSSLRARSYELLRSNYLSTKSKLKSILDKQKYVNMLNEYMTQPKRRRRRKRIHIEIRQFCIFCPFFLFLAKLLKVVQHHHNYIQHQLRSNHRFPVTIRWHLLQRRLYLWVHCTRK